MSRGDLVLLLAGALAVTLSYPPFHLFVPSFVCMVPAVLLLERSNAHRTPIRKQVTLGFWFGVLTYGLLLYWMVFALWRYTPLSVLGYAGAVLLLSAHAAALFAMCGWVLRTTRLSLLVVFPAMWTAHEWIVAHQGDLRFPWLGLGTSLTGFPTGIQIADIVGARGVTFLLALANATLAVAWLRRFQRRRAISLVGAVVVGIVAAFGYGIVRENTMELRATGKVLLAQPNVGYEEKRDSTLRETIVSSLIQATAAAQRDAKADLIVWPEVAIPGVLLWHPDWMAQVTRLARQLRKPVVVGSMYFVQESAASGARFNSAFVFDSTGVTNTQQVYSKRYLVPITEQLPLAHGRWASGRWFGNLQPGEAGETYDVGIGKFGLLICYESAFENLSRQYRIDGADFLVNITNDGWFGRTSAPFQHAAHLVMRAIENRVAIARAANTGFTEIVDPLGHEHHRSELEVETFVSGELLTSDVLTVYTRLGDWVGSTVVMTVLVLVGYAWWLSRQQAVS